MPKVDDDDNVFPRIPKHARRNEVSQYDPRVQVYWDVKAMAGCAVSEAWLEDFDRQTKTPDHGQLLGLDNWISTGSKTKEDKACVHP